MSSAASCWGYLFKSHPPLRSCHCYYRDCGFCHPARRYRRNRPTMESVEAASVSSRHPDFLFTASLPGEEPGFLGFDHRFSVAFTRTLHPAPKLPPSTSNLFLRCAAFAAALIVVLALPSSALRSRPDTQSVYPKSSAASLAPSPNKLKLRAFACTGTTNHDVKSMLKASRIRPQLQTVRSPSPSGRCRSSIFTTNSRLLARPSAPAVNFCPLLPRKDTPPT